MEAKDLTVLQALCSLHSTPGDEGDVAEYLLKTWSAWGWKTFALGRYAVYGTSPGWAEGRPTVMFCAHMDSPGFIVQSLQSDDPGRGIAVALGGPHFEDASVDVVIRSSSRTRLGTLEPEDTILSKHETFRIVSSDGELERGARVCYRPQFSVGADSMVRTPFLDNRVGCWGLCRLAEALSKGAGQEVNVIIAATGCEEMTGFGADVLCSHVHADAVICLDGTYTDEAQGIAFEKGPVLTVSDKSTLLSPKVVRCVEEMFSGWGIPLQKEVYNFSGTDARSFPVHGHFEPVLAILLPTSGNHEPIETTSLADLRHYEEMLLAFCRDGSSVQKLIDAWNYATV